MRRKNIRTIAEKMHCVQNVFFVTGAGISSDSGIPTYRGAGGLYRGRLTEEGMPIEEALSKETMQSSPEVTWRYLFDIEKACRGAKFNRAHEIMAMCEKVFEKCVILTQNVDGLHQKAGSGNVIDLHGDIHALKCLSCSWTDTVEDYSTLSFPPKCSECGDFIRPDVVLFGEMLPQKKLKRLEHEVSKGNDMYFSVGTSSLFAYIQQPVFLGKAQGACIVEINPSTTEISRIADHHLKMRASEALDALWKEYTFLSVK